MRATMIMLFPYQTSAGTVRRIRVSLPRIDCLVDNHRYFLPEDLPPPARDDLRAWLRPKLGKIVQPVKLRMVPRPASPSLVGSGSRGNLTAPSVLSPMPIEPPEIPPSTPGQPTEPPREEPPGNPRPEVPPPMPDPGRPPPPQELPGKMPDELPVRGPNGPLTPNPATDQG